MKNQHLEKSILEMEGIITTLDHAIANDEYTSREAWACQLLKDARLKLIEELEERQIVEIDFSQYTCEKCGKKGVCEEGMDVFIACLCQTCYDTLWAEYVQVMTKPAESEG